MECFDPRGDGKTAALPNGQDHRLALFDQNGTAHVVAAQRHACGDLAHHFAVFQVFGSAEDLANHLVGAVLMGVGGIAAMGCTVGQGLSGLSTLNLTSFVAVAGIVAGAVTALRYQMWRVERLA